MGGVRRAALLLVLAALAPGCAFPWQEEPQDPAALGPPEPVSVRMDHDFLGSGRNLPFRLNTSTGTVTVRMELAQNPGAAACMEDRTPPTIRLFRPGEERLLELVAPIGPGGAKATADGGGECGATLERTLPRERGVWRVGFTGSGNFTGVVTVTGAGATA